MPHIIQRSTLKDTLNDILHVLGKVQIGRIGIPKQIRGEIFNTLPRGTLRSLRAHFVRLPSEA